MVSWPEAEAPANVTVREMVFVMPPLVRLHSSVIVHVAESMLVVQPCPLVPVLPPPPEKVDEPFIVSV